MWCEMFVKFKNNFILFYTSISRDISYVCYKHCFELNFRLQNISSSVIFKAALQKRWIKTFNINEENRYLWYHMFIEISYKQKKNGRSRIHNCSTILQLVFNIILNITFNRKMLISNDFQQQCLYLHSYLYKYKSIMSSRYNNIG